MIENHLSNEQIQSLVDGVDLPTAGKPDARRHLSECARCKNAYEKLEELDQTLKQRPLQKPGTEFTRNVMMTLGLAPGTSFMFRIVENFAYVFGMMLVLGITLTVLVFTGAVDSQPIHSGQGVFESVTKMVGGGMRDISNSLTAFVIAKLPFIFGRGAMNIAGMGFLVVGILAVIDKYILRKMFR